VLLVLFGDPAKAIPLFVVLTTVDYEAPLIGTSTDPVAISNTKMDPQQQSQPQQQPQQPDGAEKVSEKLVGEQ